MLTPHPLVPGLRTWGRVRGRGRGRGRARVGARVRVRVRVRGRGGVTVRVLLRVPREDEVGEEPGE